MTALERATRKLIRVARRWRLGLTQDALSQKLCTEHLSQVIGEHFAVEFRALQRQVLRRKKSRRK